MVQEEEKGTPPFYIYYNETSFREFESYLINISVAKNSLYRGKQDWTTIYYNDLCIYRVMLTKCKVTSLYC